MKELYLDNTTYHSHVNKDNLQDLPHKSPIQHRFRGYSDAHRPFPVDVFTSQFNIWALRGTVLVNRIIAEFSKTAKPWLHITSSLATITAMLFFAFRF